MCFVCMYVCTHIYVCLWRVRCVACICICVSVVACQVCCICLYDGGCRTPTKVICGKSFNCCFKWGGKVGARPLTATYSHRH